MSLSVLGTTSSILPPRCLLHIRLSALHIQPAQSRTSPRMSWHRRLSLHNLESASKEPGLGLRRLHAQRPRKGPPVLGRPPRPQLLPTNQQKLQRKVRTDLPLLLRLSIANSPSPLPRAHQRERYVYKLSLSNERSRASRGPL
jgi:hypothetical protein